MRIAALLLAAGRSTRMGANKLLEILHEKPLVRHVADAARASHASPLIIVTGHERDALRATLADIDATFVDNPLYAEGLSTSLKAGLAAIPQNCDGAVILLGDMPRVTPEIINALIAAAPQDASKIAAVPVVGGEWGNPVVLMRAAFADASALDGDAGARKYLMQHRETVIEVPVGDDAVLLDLDTPEALARARMTS